MRVRLTKQSAIVINYEICNFMILLNIYNEYFVIENCKSLNLIKIRDTKIFFSLLRNRKKGLLLLLIFQL